MLSGNNFKINYLVEFLNYLYDKTIKYYDIIYSNNYFYLRQIIINIICKNEVF